MACDPVTKERVCLQCGCALGPEISNHMKLCGQACRRQRSIDRKRRARESNPNYAGPKLGRPKFKDYTCAGCGEQFSRPSGRRPLVFCSARCSTERFRKYDTINERRRAADNARRARLLSAVTELFAPIEIFERDNWRCHLCGVRTPKKLRGTKHPHSPELDHIIPLSKGGDHTRQNTACACCHCNASKGGKMLGQQRLFG